MLIPGFLITLVTFPGVIVHEFAHALFCRMLGLNIYEVKYFQFSLGRGVPAGYVVHEISPEPWRDVMAGIGPFFVNTFLAAVIGFPAAIPTFKFGTPDLLDLFLLWIAISIGMHAFPSTGDAASISQSIKTAPLWTKLVGYPIVGLIWIVTIGRFFWLDALYGIGVVCLLPNLIVWIAS